MHIGRSIDAARRRVVIRVPERMSGAQVVKALAELFVSRPQLASYDFVFNLLRFGGDTGNEDVEAVKAFYGPLDRTPGIKHTTVVSLDPNFPLWAQTMDHYFDDRRHHVFATQAEAEQFLDDVRGQANGGG